VAEGKEDRKKNVLIEIRGVRICDEKKEHLWVRKTSAREARFKRGLMNGVLHSVNKGK